MRQQYKNETHVDGDWKAEGKQQKIKSARSLGQHSAQKILKQLKDTVKKMDVAIGDKIQYDCTYNQRGMFAIS